MSKKNRILIVGGKSYQSTQYPRIGGTTVLMDNYIDYCDRHDIPYIFVSTNRYVGKLAGVRNKLSMFFGVLVNAPRCSTIMVNISSKQGIHQLLPMAVYIGRLFGLFAVCRMFAGNIHKYLESRPKIKTKVYKWLGQTKVAFFETREIVDYFKSNDVDVVWFPNVRVPNPYHVPSSYVKRFVFVSQVKQEKGIDQILEAAEKLPEGYTIDIYGPIVDDKYNEEFLKHAKNINYCGVLNSDKVVETLSGYNVLLLPTYWDAEGYPGIIIEAMSVGMPVITTPTGGIVELIENNKNGLLISQKDSTALKNAILSYDQEKYEQHVKKADEFYGENYNSEIINDKVTKLMLN